MAKLISRLLIANRGEIARRIMRSAHAMGIGSVAIYAEGDAEEPFVQEADQAIALGGFTSRETYLNIEKVLAAAKQSGADAIHPGYGFLSENGDFAKAVTEAGLLWVGPDPEAIAQMGDKLSSKRLIHKAGVPTLPSVELEAGEDAAAPAATLGYPLLVKASAGGGGKGMRVVESEAKLSTAIESARREAAAAFGDDTIFLERWLTAARHVEIQVLGDEHGNIVHCFERECSIQRRHQKIIEEAPSSVVDTALRSQMGAAAVSVAQAIGYTSAGTVEFLLQGQEFWFLEMNTRLQVEHPVTEEITGLDLVREQLLIAQGEPLSVSQEDLGFQGHAIEARLYAEDPAQDFLPAAGRVLLWEPSRYADARFDSGIKTGSTVGIEFDPMLAKVIVHAATRREAALRLARVLETTRIQGITTNRDFLVSVLRTPEFILGETTTDFIERVDPPRTFLPQPVELGEAAIAVTMMAQAERRDRAGVLQSIPSGWRNTIMPAESVSYQYKNEKIGIQYRSQRDGSFLVRAGENQHNVRIKSRKGHRISLEIDKRRLTFTVIPHEASWSIHGPGGQVELQELPRFPTLEQTHPGGNLTAPMPGNVVATHVALGEKVEKGQVLLILEAMKMEHPISAPVAGTVEDLKVQAGDQVANGEVLIVLTEGEPN